MVSISAATAQPHAAESIHYYIIMRDSFHRYRFLYTYIEVFVLRKRVELEARE